MLVVGNADTEHERKVHIPILTVTHTHTHAEPFASFRVQVWNVCTLLGQANTHVHEIVQIQITVLNSIIRILVSLFPLVVYTDEDAVFSYD